MGGRGGLGGDEEQPAREQARLANGGRGSQGTCSSSSGHGGSRRRRNNRWENGQTVMDSCNRIYHGVENEEIYLWVVMVVTGPRRFAQKILPEVHQKPSIFRTSASDLGGYGWRLRKHDVLLEPLSREEHQQVFIGRIWVGGKIRVLGLF